MNTYLLTVVVLEEGQTVDDAAGVLRRRMAEALKHQRFEIIATAVELPEGAGLVMEDRWSA